MSGPRMVAICLLGLGLACGITSTALDYWYYVSATKGGVEAEGYLGLWEVCFKALGKAVCTPWSTVGEELDIAWLHACQAAMIIGVLLNGIACLLAVFATVKHSPVVIVQGIAIVSVLCYAVGAAVFGFKYEQGLSDQNSGGTLHAGFVLAIVAAVVNALPICVLSTPAAREPAGAANFQRF